MIFVIQGVHYKDFYDKLGIWDGERDLYQLVKSRRQRTPDIEDFCCINDNNGALLTDRQAATDRWRADFAQISLPKAPPTFGAIETEETMKRMKSGKATGSDDIVAEL